MSTLASEALTGLVPALIAAQAAFKPAIKDARNTHFGSAYLTLGAALDAILPSLNANGLALVQHVTIDDNGAVVLVTRLYHANGEWLSSEYPVLPTRGDPQGYGSALTYARRYAAMSLVGVAPEDDDADAACAANAANAAYPAGGTRTQRYGPHVARKRGSASAAPAAHAVTAPADLADAIDSATSVEQLERLVPSLQAMGEDVLPPLRRRYAERKEYLTGDLLAGHARAEVDSIDATTAAK